MRRIPSTDDSQTVSLFPFLAVLLSTMGALLIVLVAMARQARLQAAQKDESPTAPASAPADSTATDSPSPSSPETSELEAAAARLEEIRQAGLQELEESRLRLRHADHHLRELQEEVADLYRQVRSLEEMGSHRLADQEQAQQELERLHDLIRDTEARLDESRRQAQSQQKSYAIVPYEGPHGTLRRPLYIECRRDAVVLQPEGIELHLSDFQGPLGPGNPLASALRAADEYYASTAPAGEAAAEPYPLVLVRPDGIAAYYFVRRALEGWGAAFGYELLDGDWKLEFPLPNPQVANAQQQAINLARARQQALALAAPRQFGGDRGGGGIGGTAEGGSNRFLGGFESALPGGADHGGGRWGAGSGDVYARNASHPQHGTFTASGAASTRTPEGSPGAGPGGGRPGENPATSGTAENAASPGGGAVHSGTARSKGRLGATPNARNTPPGNQPQRHGQPPAANSPAGLAGGQAGGTPGATGTRPGGSPRPSGGSSPTGGTGPQLPTTNSAGAAHALSYEPKAQVEPMATVRGANWALPAAGSGAVPIHRAIRVVVRQDRLAILPEQNTSRGRVIYVADSVHTATDPFVQAIGEHIESWGTAGRGHYWQPILIFISAPDGQRHTAMLRRLLAGSGLEMAP